MRSLGCDIGSAFGYTSYLSNANDRYVLDLVPAQYPEGIPTTAYVSPPDGKEIVVFQNNRPARVQYGRSGYRQLVESVKRVLDKGEIHVEGVNRAIAPTEIYTAIIRDMVESANRALVEKGQDPIYDVVFTFPASFADQAGLLDRMQKSIESVTLGGHPLHVCGRLPEPAAAAIDYLHYMQFDAPESARIDRDSYTVLIYDLGHGTFDTAIVTAQSKRGSEPYILHQKDGLPIGGQDFDALLAGEIERILRTEHNYVPKSDSVKHEIKKLAVTIKHELSDALQGTQSFQQVMTEDDRYLEVSITRNRFEELSRGLLTQTMMKVYDCLQAAKMQGITIDQIVCTGGSSAMPMVKNALLQLVENKIGVTIYKPSQSVSYGAARYALGIEEIKPVEKEVSKKAEEKRALPAARPTKKPSPVLEQRTDCCYGIRVVNEEGKSEVRYLIQSGQTRPVQSKSIQLDFDNTHVRIWIYRSNQKNGFLSRGIPEENATSVQQVWFDVQPGIYTVTLTAKEEYDILVTLEGKDGAFYQRSTSETI